MLTLDTRKLKPSQRCPQCHTVHKEWADLSNRYHVCDKCGFEIERDKGSVLLMYNVATNKQPELGTSSVSLGCSSSTSDPKIRKNCGGMKQLGQMKRRRAQVERKGKLKPQSPTSWG